MGCHFLLQETFPTQGSNPGLLHCRQTLYCLSHQESPCIWLLHLNGKRIWKIIDTYICITESLCCTLETNTTLLIYYQFSSVAQLFPTLCDPMDCSMPGFPCPSPIPRAYSNSGPLNQWCHTTISSSVVPFFSCFQSFPASSGSFPISQFFTWDGQSIGVSASASVLPMNIQDWLSLGLTGLISCSLRDSQVSSPVPQFKSINSSVLSFFYGPIIWRWCDHSPGARHPGMWSQVGLRKHH